VRILDKKTRKAYPVNTETLIHLGATDVKVFKSDFEDPNFNESQFYVLGLPAPALSPLQVELLSYLEKESLGCDKHTAVIVR